MRAFAAVFLGAALLPGMAAAAGLEAEYTDLDFKDCTTISADEMGATSVCAGYRGYPVVVGEGDLRQFVSYGIRPTEEKAIEQTLPPFNHVGKKIEWRIDASDRNDPQPRATILRWFIDPDEGVGRAAGEVLVITQIKLGATCHIAYIDAKAVKNANELARKIADEKAGGFDCAKEPETIQPFAAY